MSLGSKNRKIIVIEIVVIVAGVEPGSKPRKIVVIIVIDIVVIVVRKIVTVARTRPAGSATTRCSSAFRILLKSVGASKAKYGSFRK